mmetsp:Transcript_7164/g.30505  ORF Transcript_7164/g.30505 Transcript_7164/m.30505 type:complete len:378 (-) Transcript_7164:1019-2152(-)
MYNQIGLKTPRGSGTNGYVQRNLAFRQQRKPRGFREEEERKPPKMRVANPEILEHQRRRQVEIMLIKWYEAEEIFERYGEEEGTKLVDERRQALLKDLEEGKLNVQGDRTETHQRNQEKERRNASFKNALRINKDYVAGAVFDPEEQERRKQQRYEERLEREKEKVKQQLERELQQKMLRHKRKHGYDEEDDRRSKRRRSRGSYDDDRGEEGEVRERRSRGRSPSPSRSRSRSRRRRRDSRSPSSSRSRSSGGSRSRSPRRSRGRKDSRSPSSRSRSRSSASRSPRRSRSRSPRRSRGRKDSPSPSPSPSPSRSPRRSRGRRSLSPSPDRRQSERSERTSAERGTTSGEGAVDEEGDEEMYTVSSVIVIPSYSALAR